MIELDKIYNMDCLEGMKQMEAESVDCIITSPPYNVGLSYNEYDDSKEYSDKAVRRIKAEQSQLTLF